MGKPEQIISSAESQLGAPYVYGTWGQPCTPSLRKRYAKYSPSQAKKTYERCQVLRSKNPKASCDGCQYEGMLAFDCRGFTHWCLMQAGIKITGDYVKRQWSDPNWDVKGNIDAMPRGVVACLFIADMSHTGMYLTGLRAIHCSGEVKEETLGKGRKWAKYAVPKGLYTWQELSEMFTGGYERMLKKGMRGDDVVVLQVKLNALGYDCGTADGVFGKKTEAAVKAFQADNELVSDGIVGPATWDMLMQKAPSKDEPDIKDDDAEPDKHIDRICESITAIGSEIADINMQLTNALKQLVDVVNALREGGDE